MLAFVGFLLIWTRVKLERANLVIASIVIGVAGLGGAEVWGPRPQMITFTFTCLEVLWLDRYLRGKSRAIYFLPLVMIAWALLRPTVPEPAETRGQGSGRIRRAPAT